MNIQILSDFQLNIYGFGSIAPNKDYAETAFKLSGKMWEVVKKNNIKNKGKNIWFYGNDDKVFAGVELENQADSINSDLEKLEVKLDKYAYFNHRGPYNLIKSSGQNMSAELSKKGFQVILPYIEIYGHWTANETTLETELLMCLR